MTNELLCGWSGDEDGNWDTGCGGRFMLNDGIPSQNGMKFCCYCGKPLIEALYQEEPDDE